MSRKMNNNKITANHIKALRGSISLYNSASKDIGYAIKKVLSHV